MKRQTCILILSVLSNIWIAAQTDTSNVTLSQCITAALDYNPYIRESANEKIISELAVSSARSGLYPKVSTELAGGFSNEYRLNNNYKTWSATLSASQILWQNGKIRAEIENAGYNSRVAGYSLEAQKQEIILSVRLSYFKCLMQNQLYRIAVENVSRSVLFLEYARERYKIGAGRKSDVLKAESDLGESEFERDSYKNSINKAVNELSMLTGLAPVTLTKLESLKPNLLNFSAGNLDTLSILNYPELQAIKYLELAQAAMIRETRAALYPSAGINGTYNKSYNPALSQVNGWSGFLTVSWTLFNGNYQRNQIRTERVRKDAYRDREEEVKTFLIKELSDKLIDMKLAVGQIILTERLMKTTSANLEIATAQYSEGTGSMLELYDARVNDLSAKQKNIEAITSWQIAEAKLERITGYINEN
jgi:outer membrane protein